MSKVDNIKWKLFCKKYNVLLNYGFLTGKIKTYDADLIDKLRNVYYGGFPASIVLLTENMVRHKCYDRAVLMTHAFKDDDFEVVHASIDGIALDPRCIEKFGYDPLYADHCFVERKDENGCTWVYDTTYMLIYDKSLYYKMHRPVVRRVNSKEETLSFCDFVDVENADIERDKYVVPLLFPTIERCISTQKVYRKELDKEVALYKEKIDYDGLCAEMPSARAYKK